MGPGKVAVTRHAQRPPSGPCRTCWTLPMEVCHWLSLSRSGLSSSKHVTCVSSQLSSGQASEVHIQ